MQCVYVYLSDVLWSPLTFCREIHNYAHTHTCTVFVCVCRLASFMGLQIKGVCASASPSFFQYLRFFKVWRSYFGWNLVLRSCMGREISHHLKSLKFFFFFLNFIVVLDKIRVISHASFFFQIQCAFKLRVQYVSLCRRGPKRTKAKIRHSGFHSSWSAVSLVLLLNCKSQLLYTLEGE